MNSASKDVEAGEKVIKMRATKGLPNVKRVSQEVYKFQKSLFYGKKELIQAITFTQI